MSEGALPAAEVGARQGETAARRRRWNHLQGVWVLQYRLSEQLLQGSREKGDVRFGQAQDRGKRRRRAKARKAREKGRMKIATPIQLTCPDCQRENEAERIYCHDCGARLDRSALA